MNHVTRFSDSSLYDEVCVNCGATDGSGDGRLDKTCPSPGSPYPTIQDYYKEWEKRRISLKAKK